jgi:hypothetical protein
MYIGAGNPGLINMRILTERIICGFASLSGLSPWRSILMEKVDFLNYRAKVREVQQLRAQLLALESSLYSPKGQRSTSTPHASSGPKKTMEDAVAGHMRLEALYREKLTLQEAQLYDIEEALDSLEDPAQRIIMRERYVLGHSWLHICEKLRGWGYSERQVYRLHGLALLKLKEV